MLVETLGLSMLAISTLNSLSPAQVMRRQVKLFSFRRFTQKRSRRQLCRCRPGVRSPMYRQAKINVRSIRLKRVLLAFVHIERAAGTTLEQILLRNFLSVACRR